MKKQSRILCFLLAALLCSCGQAANDGPSETTADSGASDTTAAETEYLPDRDYEGADFNMLVRTEFLYEFGAEESGDVVDDAVYARNRAIEEKYNITLKLTDVAGSFSLRDTFLGVLSNDILSGSGEFDLVASAANYMLPVIPEGYFLDLCDTPFIDLSKPWWSKGYVDNMMIDNSLYLATGSASMNLLENMCVIFFNKQMIEDYDLDDPYTLVESGDWTFGRMMDAARTVNSDLNGNDKLDSEDRVGLFTYGNMTIAQQVSFGLPFSERDADGYPRITYMSERMADAFELIKGCLAADEICMYEGTGDTLKRVAEMQSAFQNNNILYMAQVLSSAGVMRSMSTDFGILPMPKLDDEQERYYTCVLENLTVLGIPSSVEDDELSGLVLESMAQIGHETVTPTYFGKALGAKYIRDEQSNEMLELIRDSAWFDFAYLNSVSLDNINHLFNNNLNGSLVSAFEGKREIYESKLETLLDGYRKLKE